MDAVCEVTAAPFAVKAEASFSTPDAGARIDAYRFREAYGVLRLAGAFGPEQESRPLQTIMNASSKSPQPFAVQSGSKLHALHMLARGSMLASFAKRMECSGLPALSDRSRIATIAVIMNASREVTAAPFAVKAEASFSTPDAGARIDAYRFREAYGVLRLAGAFGPEQESRPLQTIMNASSKSPQPFAVQSGSKLHALHMLARGSMLASFAKRMECSGLPALSDRSRIATIAVIMNASRE